MAEIDTLDVALNEQTASHERAIAEYQQAVDRVSRRPLSCRARLPVARARRFLGRSGASDRPSPPMTSGSPVRERVSWSSTGTAGRCCWTACGPWPTTPPTGSARRWRWCWSTTPPRTARWSRRRGLPGPAGGAAGNERGIRGGRQCRDPGRRRAVHRPGERRCHWSPGFLDAIVGPMHGGRRCRCGSRRRRVLLTDTVPGRRRPGRRTPASSARRPTVGLATAGRRRRLVNSTGDVDDPVGQRPGRRVWLHPGGQGAGPSEVFGFSERPRGAAPGALDEVGLLDERLFMYYEDAELCGGLRRVGGASCAPPPAPTTSTRPPPARRRRSSRSTTRATVSSSRDRRRGRSSCGRRRAPQWRLMSQSASRPHRPCPPPGPAPAPRGGRHPAGDRSDRADEPPGRRPVARSRLFTRGGRHAAPPPSCSSCSHGVTKRLRVSVRPGCRGRRRARATQEIEGIVTVEFRGRHRVLPVGLTVVLLGGTVLSLASCGVFGAAAATSPPQRHLHQRRRHGRRPAGGRPPGPGRLRRRPADGLAAGHRAADHRPGGPRRPRSPTPRPRRRRGPPARRPTTARSASTSTASPLPILGAEAEGRRASHRPGHDRAGHRRHPRPRSSAHRRPRRQDDIARQYLEVTKPDVILGGGEDWWLPRRARPGAFPDEPADRPRGGQPRHQGQPDRAGPGPGLRLRRPTPTRRAAADGDQLLGLFANEEMFQQRPEGQGDEYAPVVAAGRHDHARPWTSCHATSDGLLPPGRGGGGGRDGPRQQRDPDAAGDGRARSRGAGRPRLRRRAPGHPAHRHRRPRVRRADDRGRRPRRRERPRRDPGDPVRRSQMSGEDGPFPSRAATSSSPSTGRRPATPACRPRSPPRAGQRRAGGHYPNTHLHEVVRDIVVG